MRTTLIQIMYDGVQWVQTSGEIHRGDYCVNDAMGRVRRAEAGETPIGFSESDSNHGWCILNLQNYHGVHADGGLTEGIISTFELILFDNPRQSDDRLCRDLNNSAMPLWGRFLREKYHCPPVPPRVERLRDLECFACRVWWEGGKTRHLPNGEEWRMEIECRELPTAWEHLPVRCGHGLRMMYDLKPNNTQWSTFEHQRIEESRIPLGDTSYEMIL